MVKAANLGLELGECGTPSWGPGFAFVCILQLWDNDLGALWACHADSRELSLVSHVTCPLTSNLQFSLWETRGLNYLSPEVLLSSIVLCFSDREQQ